MTIENISDTARWVAFYRAMESERSDAIFRDPYARRLAGERGERIVNTMKRGRATAWPMIVRTAVFDEIILDCIAHRGIDTVVNLAAGLDARPWRLQLPATLHWYDIDLPDILAYKREQLGDAAAACIYEAIATDLTDRGRRQALFERLGATARTALVVTEGLLVYLTAEQVGSLATDLHRVPAFSRWLIDLASPRLLKMMARSWGKQLERGNAPMSFGPAEGGAFFSTYGWRETAFRSTLEEAQRLKREMPGAGFWRVIGRLFPAKTREEYRRLSGIVLLERT
jgi:methyltransferase (TIGR00027 family)